MTESAAQKKISLNFKGLPAAAVRQIAVATCDTGMTPEQRQARQMRLGNYFSAMASQHKDLTEKLRAGTSYLEELEKNHSSVSDALDKLDAQPRRISLVGRLLGKGAAVQRDLQDIINMVQSCSSSMQNFDHILADMNARMNEQENNYREICRDTSQSGSIDPKMRQELHHLRTAADMNAEKLHMLAVGAMNARNNNSQLAIKASHVAMRLQAQLTP